MVPAYSYPLNGDPSGFWSQMHKATDGIAIMNPGNGATATVNNDYTVAVTNAINAGLHVIGYVYTSYGSRNITDVTDQIDLYFTQYPMIEGIFFDETPTAAEAAVLAYYTEISNYAWAKKGSSTSGRDMTVVLNPGIVPAEEYVALANITVVVEKHYSDYLTWSPPSYLDKYPTSKFCHLVHTAPNDVVATKTAMSLSHARGAGYVYVTDDTLPNPWDALDSQWDMQVAEATENCGHCGLGVAAKALDWLMSMQDQTTGLVVSFDAPASATWAQDRGYSYGQAVTVIALLLHANSTNDAYAMAAEKILDGVSQHLDLVTTTAGTTVYAVPFSWLTSSPGNSHSGPHRSGATAWVLQAFAMHWLMTGNNVHEHVATGIAEWLVTFFDATRGCVMGGDDVTWCSTEHNIDAFFALHLMGHLTGSSAFTNTAEAIAASLSTTTDGGFWNAPQNRYNQGHGDVYMALDVQSWGTIFLFNNHTNSDEFSTVLARSQGLIDFADEYFLSTQTCVLNDKTATGYGPYADWSNNFHSTAVWSEGSLGVAMALHRMGQVGRMREVVLGIKPLVDPTTGGVLYAANKTTVDASGEHFYPYPSDAGTAWLALTCAPKASLFWSASQQAYAEGDRVLNPVDPYRVWLAFRKFVRDFCRGRRRGFWVSGFCSGVWEFTA